MHRHLQKFAVIGISAYLVAALNLSQVMAHDYSTGQLVIAHPWAPPTLGKQRIGVVYFTLRNQGPDMDRLLAIDLPDGGQAQMHDSQMQDGVMRMRPIDAAVIPAGGELALQPGGMHVMLGDLPGPLIKGGRLRLILRFEKAGPVEAEAAIEPRVAAPSAPSPHQGH
ncbi:MAG: copper chaperone PCu(A)C [Pseudomonadota bacterium]